MLVFSLMVKGGQFREENLENSYPEAVPSSGAWSELELPIRCDEPQKENLIKNN